MDIILYLLLGILILTFVGYVTWLVYKIIITIYHKTLRYETFSSTAKVCDKDYENDHTVTICTMVGKKMIPQIYHFDDEFNVYLLYDGKQYCFDNEDLYNSVNINDNVSVLVHKGYNKNDELKHVYLSIEE